MYTDTTSTLLQCYSPAEGEPEPEPEEQPTLLNLTIFNKL